jgi:predicted peptidase
VRLHLAFCAIFTIVSGAFPGSAYAADSASPRQQVKSFEKVIPVTFRLQYLISLPDGYDAQEKWPLVLFLHGSGERGTDIEAVKKNGPPKLVEEQNYPFILVSPQAPENRWDTKALGALLDEVIAGYKVDPDRVYVTGLSLGGGGTWNLVAAFPEKFAAAIPVCGWNPNPNTANKIKDVAFWVFHGDADKSVPLQHSQRMVDALKPLGTEVKFTIYPGVGHNCWEKAYAEPELWTWLLSHTRKKPESK